MRAAKDLARAENGDMEKEFNLLYNMCPVRLSDEWRARAPKDEDHCPLTLEVLMEALDTCVLSDTERHEKSAFEFSKHPETWLGRPGRAAS